MTRRHASAIIGLVALAMAATSCSGDDGQKPAVELGEEAIGWCLNVADDVGPEISKLPTIGCDEPHTHEVFAVLKSAAEAYPGFEALEREAQVRCLEAFEPYVGISAFDTKLFYSWMVPTLTSWEDTEVGEEGERGDREIICVVGDGDGAPLTSSVRNSGR